MTAGDLFGLIYCVGAFLYLERDRRLNRPGGVPAGVLRTVFWPLLLPLELL